MFHLLSKWYLEKDSRTFQFFLAISHQLLQWTRKRRTSRTFSSLSAISHSTHPGLLNRIIGRFSAEDLTADSGDRFSDFFITWHWTPGSDSRTFCTASNAFSRWILTCLQRWVSFVFFQSLFFTTASQDCISFSGSCNNK